MSSIGEIAKFRSSIQTDTVNEYTSASGVTVDSVLLKDAEVTASGTGGVITNVIKAQAASGVKFQENGGGEVGSYTDDGLWTLGPSGGADEAALTHNIYFGKTSRVAHTRTGATGLGWLGTKLVDEAGAERLEFAINIATNGYTTGAAGDAVIACNSKALIFTQDRGATSSGSISSTGAWTLGPDAGGVTHRLNTNTTTAGANTATLTNAPVSGDPVAWVTININGTDRCIPVWAVS